MNRLFRTTTVLSAAGLALTLAIAPAAAATKVAEGTASAVKVTIAGTPAYSGTYTATNDGSKETTSGQNSPTLTVLGGQQAVNQGVLNQDAATAVSGGKGSVDACAGLSGDGSSTVAVGRTDCLEQGRDTAALGAGSLDFSKFDPFKDIIDGGALNDAFISALPAALQDAVRQGSTALATQLTAALQQFIAAVGSPSLTLNAGLIQGVCSAADASSSGDADLAGLSLNANLGTYGNVVLPLEVDEHPAPNTKVVTNLDQLTAALTKGLTDSLTAGAAQGGPLAGLFTALGGGLSQADAINAIVAQISSQLGPVEDNLLDITANKQEPYGANGIHVTALDVQALPAAQQAIGTSLAAIQIGDVTCAAGRLTQVSAPAPARPAPAQGVPAAVDSGLSGEQPSPVLPVIGGLLLVSAAGLGVRRLVVARRG